MVCQWGERLVIISVGRYGKQLGKLTEAMLAVVDKAGLEGKEIDELRAISEGVKEAKGRALEAVKEAKGRALEAVKALERVEVLEGVER